MKHKLIIFFLLAICALQVTAQEDDPILNNLLQNKRTLPQVMEVINTYFKSPALLNRVGPKKAERSLKHWKRWEYWWSSRVGADGEFINVSEKMIAATGLQQNRKLTANASPNSVESVSGNWGLVGPTATTNGIGRIDRLAFHPTDPDIIYAGAAGGGLWKTTNGGITWSNLTADLPCMGISGIAINPNNTNEIFILTGDGDSDLGSGGLVSGFGYMRRSIGVLKTSDGGINWEKMGAFPGTTASLLGYRLVMHPTNSDILFACTNNGLFRTNNGGVSWTNVRDNGKFYNLAFKPGSFQICYATGRSSSNSRAYFWRSVNGGLTWDSTLIINNQINTPTSRVELAVAQSNSNVVYLLCGGVPDSAQYKGLYRSDNSGLSFTLQSTSPNIVGGGSLGNDDGGQSSYDLTVAASTTTSNTVIVGAIEAWRSLDAGVNWVFRGSGVHSDIHEMNYNPIDNKLWAATDGGVYSSVDNGANWTSHFTGMSISQFYRLAVSPEDANDLIGGLQDNGVKQRVTNNGTFESIGGADGYCVGYDAGNPSIYYSVNNSGINKYTSYGANANGITPSFVNLTFFTNMAMHSTQAGAFFLASDTFRRVTNGGATWGNYIAAAPNMPLGGWYLQTCPSNSTRIYMAGGGGFSSATGTLRRSDDGGTTWPFGNMILSSNPGFPATFPKITCINVNPTNSSQVWVTFGGFTDGVKVYSSSNAGLSWTDRSGSLPNVPINCVVVDNNNNAYIGTDNGVYRKSSTVNDWIPFYNNLPYVPVTDLAMSQVDNKLYASTFGRGIWSSDLYSPCPVNLTVLGTLEGQEFYEASSNVTSTGIVSGSAGTKVRMKGGQGVKLSPPFKALTNSDFKANIGPCESGLGQLLKAHISDSTELIPSNWVKPNAGLGAMVELATYSNQQIKAKLNVRLSGTVELVLTDVNGKVLQHLPAATYSAGLTEKSFNTNNLTSGTYYVHAIHNHRWEHLQEVEIH